MKSTKSTSANTAARPHRSSLRFLSRAMVIGAGLACFGALPNQAAAQLTPPPPLGQPGPPPGSDSAWPAQPTAQPGTGAPPGSDGSMPPNAAPGTVPGANPGPGMAPGAPGNDPMAPRRPKTQTEEMLDASETKDSGRLLEIAWARGEAGFSYMNLASFDASSLGIKQTGAAGPAFGLAAGFRLFIFSLGARLRLNQLSSFSMWQVNGVAALHVPISKIDVSFGLHGGYSFVGRLSTDSFDAVASQNPSDKVSVTGFNGGLGFNVDYYLANFFSIGGGVTGEALFLKRPPVPLPDIPADTPPQVRTEIENRIKGDALYQNSGTSAGFGLMVGLRLGLHLGI
jgi:hypothetical protein